MPHQMMLSVQATPDTASIRTAELFNEEHTVVPCVALVEGVLWPANAPAPELALAEEFGRFPEGWNGRPVVFDHPKVNGEAVSASDPKVLESVAFGSLFNTTVSEGKLKTEIWINNARVESMDEDVQDAVKRLTDGDETVEVSTGLFSMSEVVAGEFDGEEFEAIWRNIVPDHLAVLPEGVKGACSVEDGCGAPRTNKGKNKFTPVMRAARMNTNAEAVTCECGGTPEDCTCDQEKKGMFQKIMEVAGDFLQIRGNSKTLGDQDTRVAIQGALSNQESFFWIMTVFDGGDGEGMFVYESFETGKLYERSFSIDDDGAVTIGSEKTEVRPVTQFVSVEPEADVTDNSDGSKDAETLDGSIQENSTMNKDQLVQGLIDNESSQFTEDDREWLSTLEESQLAKFAPVVNQTVDDLLDPAPDSDPIVEEPAAAITTEDYIAAAPDAVQEVLNEGVKMHSARKKAVVDGLLANARCTFTEDQLNGKLLGELESIAAFATDITFEGSAPLINAITDDDDATPPPIALFDLSKRASA